MKLLMKLSMKHHSFFYAVFLLTSVCSTGVSQSAESSRLILFGSEVQLAADFFKKSVRLEGTNLFVDSCTVASQEVKGQQTHEISFRISQAKPNEKPLGITDVEADEIVQKASIENATDSLDVSGNRKIEFEQNVKWVEPIFLQSDRWGDFFQTAHFIVSEPKNGVKRLNIRFSTLDNPKLPDLTVNLVYELYEGHPAIRKWVEISNNSPQWIKIDELILDGLAVSEPFQTITDLTPIERGATSSIRSYSNSDHSSGIIFGSEIPSALRVITPEGRMGYANEYFEWVIGPAEQFVSEPVFHYAFFGKTVPTLSAISTALDRAIEGPFRSFLYDCVGVKNVDPARFVPLWCSWTNFMSRINEEDIEKMADIAAKCGFRGFLIDAGWGTSFSAVFAPASIIPDQKKFPNFAKTAEHITSQGLAFGLWVSCFRHPTFDPDLAALPDTYSLPKIKRDEGLAMSYASPWKYYYANNLLRLRDQYHVTYFKQDFTNIKFGDIAFTHESRTLKESYLRGLRGLFESQNRVCESSPDINIEMTHEIYWGTPGVPCDIAAMKHAHTYHIPPNDYSGVGNRGQRVNDEWEKNPEFAPEKLQNGLLRGCLNARNRFYAHRALPLQCIEYYGAATVNFRGSLTPEIQRRQVCSWLLGAPSVFAGDLASLTDENIQTYKACFDIIGELNEKYAIYRNFQYSGVPTPTETDWHWWGKLNEKEEGAVVVLRGTSGDNEKHINIPWVCPDKTYQLEARFSGHSLGRFTGQELIDGKLRMQLPNLGQEIIEIQLEENR